LSDWSSVPVNWIYQLVNGAGTQQPGHGVGGGRARAAVAIRASKIAARTVMRDVRRATRSTTA